jgi:N-methylhydantoinase B
MKLDGVTLQIFADHALAVAEGMASTLYRTAHSTFVKETEDFTTGIATPEGQTYAAPASLGSNWFVGLDYGRAIKLIDSYEEGDICSTNDPYSGNVCTHTPDIHLWKPIFHDGELISFAVGHIHNTDMGGAVPASLSRTLVEVVQEGIRITPAKLYKKGVLNTELLEILLSNVRLREQNWGDLKAQIAAMNTGANKVHDMITRFGIDGFRTGMYQLLDYSEQQTRALIRTIPDGVYSFADYIDEDAAIDGVPCRLACDMTVAGDAIICDFRRSDPQVAASMNVPTGGFARHTLLLIGIYHVFKTLRPEITVNTGMTRPFDCKLAEGNILNPEFPAAVGMRSLTATRLQDVLFGCLSQALPELMTAAPAGSISIMNVMTSDPRTGRRVMAAVNPLVGGGGAMPFADGPDGSGGNAGTLKNTPVEINELEVPIRVLRYHLAPDSGGPGRWRGGLATTFEFEIFSPNTVVTSRNRDRSRFRAWGVCGGQAGAASRYVVNPDRPERLRELRNTDIVTLGPGDIVHITSSGAGGWGDPFTRPAELVARDVAYGFVSTAAAERDYGVVVRGGEVDVDATAAARRARPAPSPSHFNFGAEREAFDRELSPAAYDRLIALLQSLPISWRAFIKHRMFAALPWNDPDAAFRQICGEFPQLGRPAGRRETAQ